MSENDKQKQKLSTKQRRAVAALLEGSNYQEAALAAGVTPRTLARWREQSDFEQALQQRSRRAIGDAARTLTAGLAHAIDFLLDVITNEDAPYSVRTRAALGLVDRQIRLAELTDVLERLEALERTLSK